MSIEAVTLGQVDPAMGKAAGLCLQKAAELAWSGKVQVVAHPSCWFDRYNQRQTIDAGNKEEKLVFELLHLKVRSRSGIRLREQFVAFAANFVRWASL